VRALEQSVVEGDTQGSCHSGRDSSTEWGRVPSHGVAPATINRKQCFEPANRSLPQAQHSIRFRIVLEASALCQKSRQDVNSPIHAIAGLCLFRHNPKGQKSSSLFLGVCVAIVSDRNTSWSSIYVRSNTLRAALVVKHTCKKFRRVYHDQRGTIVIMIDHLYTLKAFKGDSEPSRRQRPYECG